LKSTPIVESNLSSNTPSTNWQSKDDFPSLFSLYPLLSLRLKLICTRLLSRVALIEL